jgi:hypothetical protein
MARLEDVIPAAEGETIQAKKTFKDYEPGLGRRSLAVFSAASISYCSSPVGSIRHNEFPSIYA